MDNVTHTLFALTLARTRLGRVGRGVTAALVIASSAPDVDIVTVYRGTASYMKWHRGPTHGPLGIIGLGLATALIVWAVDRWTYGTQDDPNRVKRAPPPASFVMLAGISVLGVLLHVLMDFPTSYGTRLMSPFDWHWFAVDWMPIIDVYLLIALAAGLVFGLLTPETRRHNVAIALTLMAGIYAVRGAAHHRALTLAPRLFGPTLPQSCDGGPVSGSLVDRWPRSPALAPVSGRRCLVELAAMPTFLSPFRWRVVARLSNGYELQDVDILDRRFSQSPSDSEVLWRTTVHAPNQWGPPVFAASRAPTAAIFLGFSRFPSVRTTVDANGLATVRWVDMRFAGGLLTLNQPPARPAPFAVIVRVDASHQIVDDQLER